MLENSKHIPMHSALLLNIHKSNTMNRLRADNFHDIQTKHTRFVVDFVVVIVVDDLHFTLKIFLEYYSLNIHGQYSIVKIYTRRSIFRVCFGRRKLLEFRRCFVLTFLFKITNVGIFAHRFDIIYYTKSNRKIKREKSIEGDVVSMKPTHGMSCTRRSKLNLTQPYYLSFGQHIIYARLTHTHTTCIHGDISCQMNKQKTHLQLKTKKKIKESPTTNTNNAASVIRFTYYERTIFVRLATRYAASDVCMGRQCLSVCLSVRQRRMPIVCFIHAFKCNGPPSRTQRVTALNLFGTRFVTYVSTAQMSSATFQVHSYFRCI